jgi:hypothetical protein
MRALVLVTMLALFCPAAAMAQSPPPAAPAKATPVTKASAKRGGDITRDEYIERAKESAGKRFDKMDTEHKGVLTAEDRRKYHESHRRGAKAAAD